MTLHVPTIKNDSRRKWRRRVNRLYDGTLDNRIRYAYYRQAKRYPNSKAIVDVRTGNKVNTIIFPDGDDPSYDPQKDSKLRQFVLSNGEVFNTPRDGEFREFILAEEDNLDVDLVVHRPMSGRFIHVEG